MMRPLAGNVNAFTVSDAETEMRHLAHSYGGEPVPSLDGHLVDGPVTVAGANILYGFRNVRRQFLASEIVRCQAEPRRITGGRIVFDTTDAPADAHRSDLELFDEWLAWDDPKN